MSETTRDDRETVAVMDNFARLEHAGTSVPGWVRVWAGTLHRHYRWFLSIGHGPNRAAGLATVEAEPLFAKLQIGPDWYPTPRKGGTP